MKQWLTFIFGSSFLTLLAVGGFLFNRHKHPKVLETQRHAEDVRFWYVLLWLASLSSLAYIVFAFGKR